VSQIHIKFSLPEKDVVRGGGGGGGVRAHALGGARGVGVQDPAAQHLRRLQVRRVAPVRQDLVGPDPRRVPPRPLRDPPRGSELRRALRRVLRLPRPARDRRRARPRLLPILRPQDRGRPGQARLHRARVQRAQRGLRFQCRALRSREVRPPRAREGGRPRCRRRRRGVADRHSPRRQSQAQGIPITISTI